MMFIILTHDNQSTLSSFSLFLSFVTNSSVTKKALSGSIEKALPLRHRGVFQGYLTSYL